MTPQSKIFKTTLSLHLSSIHSMRTDASLLNHIAVHIHESRCDWTYIMLSLFTSLVDKVKWPNPSGNRIIVEVKHTWKWTSFKRTGSAMNIWWICSQASFCTSASPNLQHASRSTWTNSEFCAPINERASSSRSAFCSCLKTSSLIHHSLTVQPHFIYFHTSYRPTRYE